MQDLFTFCYWFCWLFIFLPYIIFGNSLCGGYRNQINEWDYVYVTYYTTLQYVTGPENTCLIYTQILITFSEFNNFFSEYDAHLKYLPLMHQSLEGMLKLTELLYYSLPRKGDKYYKAYRCILCRWDRPGHA